MRKILSTVFSLSFLLLLSLFLTPNKALAASYSLQGTVNDSIGNHIENATVTAIDSSTGSTAGSVSTDNSGSYNIFLLEGTYNVQVTPPSGGNYSSAIAYNQTISSNTTLNFTLTSAGSITIKGQLLDAFGNPVPNADLFVQPQSGSGRSLSTDNSGNYTFTGSPGIYTFDFSQQPTNANSNLPRSFEVTFTKNFTASLTNYDITVPARQVTIHVHDNSNAGVQGVKVEVRDGANRGTANVGSGITNGTTLSRYLVSLANIPTTDANGNVTLWITPNDQDNLYKLIASPPSGSPYSQFILNNVNITGAQTQIISLQSTQNSPLASINAGGSATGDFASDTNYSGGSTYSTSDTVDTTGVTNPAPQGVYQTVRYGNSFSYTFSNLTPNTAYSFRLHFNELYWNYVGARVFDVKYNGQTVLDNYDIFDAAGGKNKAIVETVTGTANNNGEIALQFVSEFDNAMVNGIELYNGTLPTTSPTPTPTISVPYAINTGGGASGSYVADTGFNGGSIYTTPNEVDTTGVTNPAPVGVYKSVRYGNFTYTLPHLTPNTNYILRLHFNEFYWTNAGDRVFDVSVNGNQVLNNYDIYQAAGARNKAVVEDIPVTANSNGNLVVQFTSVVDNAMVNGIEVVNTQ